jgi:DNA-binding MarR family transcriptional regulator
MSDTLARPEATAHELRTVLGPIVRRVRAAGDLGMSQAMVLSRLDREGPQTTSALAASAGVRPQSMAQTVGDLESAGFVRRRPDPADRRQVLIELTDDGRAALEAERRSREGWLAQAIAERLDAEEQATLQRAVELLRRLA